MVYLTVSASNVFPQVSFHEAFGANAYVSVEAGSIKKAQQAKFSNRVF